ncbi:YqjF family protein [Cellulosimicrobium cellulans]|uniref:YqjF family protein n=1 Tax=Cellulosimicrobium cellulans TaxID=1710 RepID=UPI0037F88BD6
MTDRPVPPAPDPAAPGPAAAPHRVPRIVVNAQRWEALTFLHWRADPAVVQGWLPPGLTVQEVGGTTWLGVVPFVMADVRVPPLPALGAWSTFPELNVRVYVRDRAGAEGVWFLGLWATSRAFVALTRAAGVPYHPAGAVVHARGDRVGPPAAVRYRFRSAGRGPLRVPHEHPGLRDLTFRADVRAHEEVDASSGLVRWLTARWNAYGVRAGRLWRFPVVHEPWTLRRGTLDALDTDVLDRLGLPPAGPDLVHVAAPVHARFALPRPVR